MPDRGLLEASAVEDATFDDRAGLELPNATWLQVTFEVGRDAALALMPPDAGKPIPPYARLFIGGAPAGSLALLSVGSRYRMLPRNVLVSAVGEGVANLGSTFGAAEDGDITLSRDGAEVTATVSAGAELFATVRLPSIYAIEPTMLRWDAFIASGRVDGVVQIAEVTPAHQPGSAYLTKDAVIEMNPALPRGHTWRRLQSLNLISACYAEGTLSLSAPVLQQTWS
jgi:hypothetical protein